MNLRDFENDLKDLIKVPVLDNVITVYEKWKDRIIEDDDYPSQKLYERAQELRRTALKGKFNQVIRDAVVYGGMCRYAWQESTLTGHVNDMLKANPDLLIETFLKTYDKKMPDDLKQQIQKLQTTIKI